MCATCKLFLVPHNCINVFIYTRIFVRKKIKKIKVQHGYYKQKYPIASSYVKLSGEL